MLLIFKLKNQVSREKANKIILKCNPFFMESIRMFVLIARQTKEALMRTLYLLLPVSTDCDAVFQEFHFFYLRHFPFSEKKKS